MARIEVDEEEYRANKTLRDTIANWMKIPAAKRKMLEAHRAADPKAEIPELDQPDPVESRVKPVADELAALRKQIADEKAERDRREELDTLNRKIETGLERIRRENGLTEDGVKAVRELMDKEGVTNPEIAWSYFQRMHPPQNPVTPGTGPWNFLEPPDESEKDLKRVLETHGNDDNLTLKMARDVLADIRGQSRR